MNLGQVDKPKVTAKRQWNEIMDKGINISLIASIWSKVHISKYVAPQTSRLVMM